MLHDVKRADAKDPNEGGAPLDGIVWADALFGEHAEPEVKPEACQPSLQTPATGDAVEALGEARLVRSPAAETDVNTFDVVTRAAVEVLAAARASEAAQLEDIVREVAPELAAEIVAEMRSHKKPLASESAPPTDPALELTPARPVPIARLISSESAAPASEEEELEAEAEDIPISELVAAAAEVSEPAAEIDPPSDLVDPEPIDAAFFALFQMEVPAREAELDAQVPSEISETTPVLSRVTGDLHYPPPEPALRTDTISAREAPAAAPSDEPAAPRPRTRHHVVPLGPKGEVILGIDLGTTYSCAALVENGRSQVLASRWGSPTIPSVVTFLPDGRTLVGESALRYGTDPKRTIIGAKRLLGRPYHSPVVQEVRDHFAYEIAEGEDGMAAVRIDDRLVSLEDISAAILREIRESAALLLEGRINRAVITCPAHFNERQRESVRAAGELAGFHVERVLGEPTAAALNFGIGRTPEAHKEKQKVLVYDLGGGTFDVSLLEVTGDVYEVLSTGGDTFLGGLDFDACIADIIVEAFLEKEHIDARSDPVAIARILQFAERAKRELTDRSSTIVQIDHLVVQPHAARGLTVPVRRTRVEELWAPLVEQTADIVIEVLERAKLTPGHIDQVLLVGGQSRAPIVQRRMEALFGRPIPPVVNPDEAISLGAAHFAASMLRPGGPTLIDALPMSIGVGLPGGRYKKIIERDTKLPTERVYQIRSTRDDQTRFEIMLFQGEEQHVELDEPLGIVQIDGLPRGPKGSVGLVVTLKVSADCVLDVSARETKTGKTVSAQFATRHTSEEIRKKLGLSAKPSPEELAKRRVRSQRPKGVWKWLTSLFRR